VDASTGGLAGALTALAAGDGQHHGPPCTAGQILGQLAQDDPESAAAFGRALADSTISAAAIARVLSQHGRPVQSGTVARHRRRGDANGCRCAL